MLDPQVLVLDEAVSALDVSVQAQVLNLLKDLQDELGLAYIFISHDLAAVRFMSDDVLVMKDGDVVEHAAVQQILDAPQQEYTKRLLGAIPRGYRRPRLTFAAAFARSAQPLSCRTAQMTKPRRRCNSRLTKRPVFGAGSGNRRAKFVHSDAPCGPAEPGTLAAHGSAHGHATKHRPVDQIKGRR